MNTTTDNIGVSIIRYKTYIIKYKDIVRYRKTVIRKIPCFSAVYVLNQLVYVFIEENIIHRLKYLNICVMTGNLEKISMICE